MDSLSVLKALADDSRYAIVTELRASAGPLSTAELAVALGLHPNTVRLHLERLRAAGLVTSTTVAQGAVGRPHRRWSAVPVAAPDTGPTGHGVGGDGAADTGPTGLAADGDVAELARAGGAADGGGAEPAAWRVLAHLLAEVAAGASTDAAAVAEVGAALGRDRVRGAGAPLESVVDELSRLGFDPVLEPSGEVGAAVVAFGGCPFRELAAAYPDLVCALHRGITEGVAEAASAAAGDEGAVAVTGWSSLVDPDPCRAVLT